MFSGQMVFAQLMEFLPRHEFNTCVRRYGGDSRLRGFSCRDQFLCLAFAQWTFRESLRDIETCLRAVGPKLYHAGFRGRVSRSSPADANLAHDWRIYADFAQVLMGRARRLYADEALAVMLEQTVYALDSTTIDLCLTLFPWAKFRRRKGAVKRHTLLDLRGNIPTFVPVSHGKVHDVTVLDHLPIEPGAFYVMDRGYVDFARLHRFTNHSAFFVTRAKRNLDYTRRVSRKIDKTTGRCEAIKQHRQRSDDHAGRGQVVAFASRSSASCVVLRCRNRPAIRLPDEQLHDPGADRRGVVQVPLAGRTVLQMNQAEPANQSLLRHQRECGEDTGLDRDQHLRAGGDHQTRTERGSQPVRNSANSQPHTFRENPCNPGPNRRKNTDFRWPHL